MAAKKRTAGTSISSDSLIGDLSTMLTGDEMSLSEMTDEIFVTDPENYVSSGSSLLDLIVSNRPNGGIITYGRIIELNGLEGSGKSLLCAHMIVDVQRDNGIAVWVDSEYALDDNNKAFFKAVGVDFSRLIIINEIELEKVFESIEKIINKVRQSSKDRKVIIIVDSLTALKAKSELEAGLKKDGYGTAKPKFLSDAFSRIQRMIAEHKIALVFTQQLRQKFNAMAFADPWTTSGGKALPYYASVRIRLAQKGQIKIGPQGDQTVVGTTISAKVIKNRLGPPQRTAEVDIYFDRGVDDVSSWLAVLKKKNIISGTNGRFTYVYEVTGEEHKFMTSGWKKFCDDNPGVFEEIYGKLAASMMMNYNTEGLSTLDGTAELDTGSVEEE